MLKDWLHRFFNSSSLIAGITITVSSGFVAAGTSGSGGGVSGAVINLNPLPDYDA